MVDIELYSDPADETYDKLKKPMVQAMKMERSKENSIWELEYARSKTLF